MLEINLIPTVRPTIGIIR